MMGFVVLNEIVDVLKEVITQPIYVKTDSINAFKASQYAGAIQATQVMMKNDCIWVTDTPDEIMNKCCGQYQYDDEGNVSYENS